jgi:hypothetical protein
MDRRFHLLALILVGWLAWMLITGWGRLAPGTATPEETLPTEPATENIVSASEAAPAQPASGTDLAYMETERAKWNRATTNMGSARLDLRLAKKTAWSELISTNWQTYQALRKQAEHSPTGTAHCTICNGAGVMSFCVLCEHNDGKCLTCKGTGKLSANEYCPACLGKGKCFLCGGGGRMPCPFCDDGTIDLKLPPPPKMMPE